MVELQAKKINYRRLSKVIDEKLKRVWESETYSLETVGLLVEMFAISGVPSGSSGTMGDNSSCGGEWLQDKELWKKES